MFAVAIVFTIVTIGYYLTLPKFDPFILPTDAMPMLNFVEPDDFEGDTHYWQSWKITKHDIEPETEVDIEQSKDTHTAIYKGEGTTLVRVIIGGKAYTLQDKAWIIYDSSVYTAKIVNDDFIVDGIVYTLAVPSLIFNQGV